MIFSEFVELLQASTTTGGWGEPVSSYTATGSFYARVLTGRGREFVSGAREIADRRASFITWDRADIGTEDRLRWQGDLYEITAVTRRAQDNEMQIDARYVETLTV